MTATFYIAGAVAVVATLLVITRTNAVHALLYLIVSLLSVAVVFYTLGAPFMAVLEVIVYAGAIMVLFLFAIMILSLGPQASGQERRWLQPRIWGGPAILAAILAAELIYLFISTGGQLPSQGAIEPRDVGLALFGPYLLGVELASMLLLAALVGVYHLGRRQTPEEQGGAT